ncbi:hypothetical protein C0J52_21559 [Blattella germanica]|nr:hypothetical protein C0J52_21559 [Blattella germanica]
MVAKIILYFCFQLIFLIHHESNNYTNELNVVSFLNLKYISVINFENKLMILVRAFPPCMYCMYFICVNLKNHNRILREMRIFKLI